MARRNKQSAEEGKSTPLPKSMNGCDRDPDEEIEVTVLAPRGVKVNGRRECRRQVSVTVQ
jgi:hypothetical protein